jgi:hypothetical protein
MYSVRALSPDNQVVERQKPEPGPERNGVANEALSAYYVFLNIQKGPLTTINNQSLLCRSSKQKC